MFPPLAGAPMQRLPDLNRSTTYATMPAGSRIDLWTLPVHRDMPDVRIDLKALDGSDPRAEAWVLLMDQERNVLGRMPFPRPGSSLSLLLHAPGSARGIFLGIVRSDTQSNTGTIDDSAPFSYMISVQRGDTAGFSPMADDGPAARQDAPPAGTDPASWLVALRLDSGEASWMSLGASAAAPSLLGLGQDAVVEMPLRSAGPSAGVLADRATAPPVDRLDGVVVDLTLVDLPPDLDPAALIDPSGRLVRIASADGFPLLSVARPPNVFEERRDPSPATTPVTEPTPEGIAAAIPERESTGRRVLSPSLAFGLGIGAAATLVLLLPDLMLKFSPSPPRRLLPWEQSRSRRRWRNLFGPDADDPGQSE